MSSKLPTWIACYVSGSYFCNLLGWLFFIRWLILKFECTVMFLIMSTLTPIFWFVSIWTSSDCIQVQSRLPDQPDVCFNQLQAQKSFNLLDNFWWNWVSWVCLHVVYETQYWVWPNLVQFHQILRLKLASYLREWPI